MSSQALNAAAFVSLGILAGVVLGKPTNTPSESNLRSVSVCKCSEADQATAFPPAQRVAETTQSEPQFREEEYWELETISPAREERRIIPAKRGWITVPIWQPAYTRNLPIDPLGLLPVKESVPPIIIGSQRQRVVIEEEHIEVVAIPVVQQLVKKTRRVPVLSEARSLMSEPLTANPKI